MLHRARRGKTGCRGAAGCAEAGVRERPRRWDRAARPGPAPGSRCAEAKGAGGARAPSFARFFPRPHPATSAGPRTEPLASVCPRGQVGGLGGKQGSDARGSPGCARRAWAGRSLGGTGSVRVGGPVCPPGARVLGKKGETRSGEEVNTAWGTLRDPRRCSACVFPWISSGHQPVAMRKPRPGDVK